MISAVRTGCPRGLALLLACITGLLAPAARAAAPAAPLASVGSPAFLPAASAPLIPRAKDVLSGHGWLAIPMPGAEDNAARPGAVLMHLPPRDSADRAPSGTLRQAVPLTQMPDALAAWADRVYIIFPRERGTATDSGFQRRVVSISAQSSVPGLWDYQAGPSGGGLQTLPTLEGENALVAAVGSPSGPLVLVRRGIDGTGPWALLALDSAAWREVPLPWPDAAPAPLWAAALADLDGPTLLAEDPASPGTLRVSTGRWVDPADTAPAAANASAAPVTWPTPPRTLALGPDLAAAVHRLRPLAPDGQLALVSVAGDGQASLWLALPRGPGLGLTRLASVAIPPLPVALLMLDGLGRVVTVSEEPEAAKPDGRARAVAPLALPRLAVREVSVFTGSTLYAGPARAEGLITGRDLQILTLVVAAVMLAVLMFVLRSDEQGVIPLPTGVALAPPLRRAMAAVVDVGVPIFLASAIAGVAPESLLSWTMFTNREELLPAAAAWLGTVTHCVLGETLFGATVGKKLLGLRVVAITRHPPDPAATDDAETGPDDSAPLADRHSVGTVEIGRPTLRRALIRNLLRWAAPPLALLMLLDENWRHPGDVLADTVVVIPPGSVAGPGNEA